MNCSHKVQVLLIDSEDDFAQEFAQQLNSESNDIDFGIEICQDINRYEKLNHDLYICTHRVQDENDCIEKVKAIRGKNRKATIFVVSAFNDFDFLKKLMKLKVSGFIDKNHIDVSTLIEEAKVIAETHIKVERMVEKLNKLSAK